MSLKDRALNNALAVLSGVGASYRVINYKGEEFIHDPEGVITKKPNANKQGLPKRKLLNPDKPYGAACHFIREQIKDMKVGEIREVTFGDFDPQTIRTSTSSVLSRMYGKGTYGIDNKTSLDHVDVMRYK